MFIALYRWKVKPELEDDFIEGWSAITVYYRDNFGSKGSRLHRGADGLFYAYAQWDSKEKRDSAFASSDDSLADASRKMRAAVIERLDEIHLETVADLLV